MEASPPVYRVKPLFATMETPRSPDRLSPESEPNSTAHDRLCQAYADFCEERTDLHKHIYLRRLQDTDETLFYHLVSARIEEMLPIIYTPTVGQACERFSQIYRRPRGLFIAYPNRGRIRQILSRRPFRDVDIIVVTDGERILGIGDQGADGMGIPIGKLSLYTLLGGINPDRTLPILIDVGTNNQRRLADPFYLGWHHERITGAPYDAFIDEFVQAVKDELPDVCLQWEDFASSHARPLLDRYRNELLSFNDDIQGTAATVLGATLSALAVKGEQLTDQRIALLGAGSAGIGVADYLKAALIRQGLTPNEASRRFFIVDKDGLLHDRRTDLLPEQALYAQPWDQVGHWPKSMRGAIGLIDLIKPARTTILIGLSTVGQAFTQPIVAAMAANTPRPIIFPLSNPTRCAEARAGDLIRWTEGNALIATGSPFEPVYHDGRVHSIAQCNNVYIFPAMGLAVTACRARRITDDMMLAAAEALGRLSPASENPHAPLLPLVKDLPRTAETIAVAVALQAMREGVAPEAPECVIREKIRAMRWRPWESDPTLGHNSFLNLLKDENTCPPQPS